jgi:short-subunit dehydrogenase
MDPVLGPLGQVAGTLAYQRPVVPWAGALDGGLVGECGPGYWTGQARDPVRFADALQTLAGQDVDVFVEVGPDGTLSALGPGVLPEAVFIPAQRPAEPGPAALVAALARAHVAGVRVDWPRVLPAGRRVGLPTYAFQHQRYWPQPAPVAAGGAEAASPAEARFWAAVEQDDVPGLSDVLAVDGRRPFSEVLPALAAWRRREHDRSATAAWRYKITWAPMADPDPAILAGTWLMVVPGGHADSALAAGCVQALAGRGAEVVTVTAGPAGLDRAGLSGLVTGALPEDGGGTVAGVVSLLGLAEEPLPGYPAVPAGLAGTLALIQALGDAGVTAPLWMLTCGAVADQSRGEPVSPVQAQVWGLGRVAALEYPDRWGGLVDLPPVLDERSAARLAGLLAGAAGENEVVIGAAGVRARRLMRAPRPARVQEAWVPSGAVLVTGGTGAIGGQVARWLAGRGAPRLVLASRSGPATPGVAGLAAGLAGAGSTVTVTACDIAGRETAAGLLDWVEAAGLPLCGVFHTAGVVDDGVLDRLDAGRLGTALAAKVGGATVLDQLTEGRELDAFVLFSSSAATFGSAGQGNYAAANAHLDALAESRHQRGLAATSVAWGPWAGAGLAGASAAVRDRLARGPLPPMDPTLAIRALGQAIDGGEQCLAVMDVDWAQLAAPPGAGQVPLLRDLPGISRASAGPDGTASGGQHDLAHRLAGLPPAGQIRALTEMVRAEAAAVLGHASAEALEPQRAFRDLGFDSLTAVELRNRLTGATGQSLPATLVFDYPTPHALAEKLRAVISPQDEAPAQPVLAELDKLESMLSATTAADGESDRITSRLEAVVSKWKEARTRTDGAAVAEKLESSTDDEVFDFIGKELGIS